MKKKTKCEEKWEACTKIPNSAFDRNVKKFMHGSVIYDYLR